MRTASRRACLTCAAKLGVVSPSGSTRGATLKARLACANHETQALVRASCMSRAIRGRHLLLKPRTTNTQKKDPKALFLEDALLRYLEFGAGNETRTRDLNLGKVALYQLSYSRVKPHIVRPIQSLRYRCCPCP